MREMIFSMFELVDEKKWDDLHLFYLLNATYERPGYSPYIGIKSIIDFYKFERIVEVGKHSLDGWIDSDGEACCWGQFSGVGKTGDVLSERFCDIYNFENGLIKTRRTYFFRPAI